MLAEITPVILTYNEAANIGRSLERLGWAREIVIVDSHSTDDTLAVAVHCLLVKGLLFDGKAGLLYTAQRITADLILSMHLLRRDLDK